MNESIQNVLLLEGSTSGGSERFVSLAEIFASLPSRALLWVVLLDGQSSINLWGGGGGSPANRGSFQCSRSVQTAASERRHG